MINEETLPDYDTLLCVQDFADELDKLFRKSDTEIFGMKVIVVSDEIMKHVKDEHGNPVKWMLLNSGDFQLSLNQSKWVTL